MRLKSIAVSAATLVAAASLSPLTAHAESSTTLYVNNTGSICSDSGSGTAATPYCTIQAAADAAVAGDTVSVAPGTYTAATDVTTSGTADAPITYLTGAAGGYGSSAVIDDSSSDYGFEISGASYVTVEGFTVDRTRLNAILVSDSDHVTVDSTTDYGAPSNTYTAAIEVDGTSSYVTVSRNQVYGSENNYGITINSSGTGDVLTTNVVTGPVSNGVENSGSSDAVLVSNTVIGFCGIGMEDGGAEEGAGLGATIENNVVADESCPGLAITWGADADVSTANYNLVYSANDSGTAYSVNGVNYATAAALYAATGQGADDLNSDPGISATGTITSGTSPLINSADSSAPGELTTDVVGAARVDDPLVADTGVGTYSYYDRGAYQYQDPISVGAGWAEKDISTLTLQIEAGIPADSWGKVSVTYSFGDGSSETVAAGVPVIHTYPKPGTTYKIAVTATDASGNSATGSVTWTTSGSDYSAYGPTRILDTRTSLGGHDGPLRSGSSLSLKIAGNGSIPSDVTAVVLNLTAVNATGGGNIAAAADGAAVPTASTLNYGIGLAVANEAIVPVGNDGSINLYNTESGSSATVGLIADVTGYFTPSAASGYSSLSPAPILDTRSGLGAPKAKVAALSSIPLTIDGADSGALPASGITAVALHVTTTNATGSGFLTVFPDGQSVPIASNLNFTAGSTISNTVIVPVGLDGKIRLYNGSGSGSVDMIANVTGYYSTSSSGAYVPVEPTRILDTRDTGALHGGSVVTVSPSKADPSIPSTASAYAANLTITSPTGSGLLIAYPTGSTRPGASNLSYAHSETIADLAQVDAGTDGDFNIYNQEPSGTVEAIVDVSGYYTSY